ncbi:MAG TPA: hypothetical protein VF438_03080, partial [Candidatus Paceibacterota bacterium]
IRMTPAQVIFDGILVLFYLFIPFHISEPNIFVGLLMLFFAVTTLKYVVLVGKVSHPKLLSYKIIVDSLGFVLCALVYGGVALGYTLTSLWAFTIIFGLATIYLFCIKPLYKLDTISV